MFKTRKQSDKNSSKSSYTTTVGSNNNNRLKDIILNNPDQTIIGYDSYKDKFYSIPSQTRVHTFIVGETGSGKSETVKLLIYQHIIRKEGFMLIDPHGMLARSVLRMLKREMNEEEFNNNVIYINPSMTQYKINPLEVKDYSKRHIVVMSFINALKNLYEYAWGDRLETILRNAVNLVMESDSPCTLTKIARVLADNKYRDMLVKGSVDKDYEYFWYSVYPNYAREAFTAVYNKLDKLLSINSVRSVFNVEESNLDISQAVDSRKIIIVDLASGFTDDIIKFLASIFIHMLYITAKRIDKIDIELIATQSTIAPYYLYIDEAQLIATFAIREVLNAMRKFGVKVTLATQTINAFEKDVQREIPALCRCIICFRSDIDTANAFSYLFNVRAEHIYTLPLHYFYFYSQGEESIRGLAKSYVIRE